MGYDPLELNHTGDDEEFVYFDIVVDGRFIGKGKLPLIVEGKQ